MGYSTMETNTIEANKLLAHKNVEVISATKACYFTGHAWKRRVSKVEISDRKNARLYYTLNNGDIVCVELT